MGVQGQEEEEEDLGSATDYGSWGFATKKPEKVPEKQPPQAGGDGDDGTGGAVGGALVEATKPPAPRRRRLRPPVWSLASGKSVEELLQNPYLKHNPLIQPSKGTPLPVPKKEREAPTQAGAAEPKVGQRKRRTPESRSKSTGTLRGGTGLSDTRQRDGPNLKSTSGTSGGGRSTGSLAAGPGATIHSKELQMGGSATLFFEPEPEEEGPDGAVPSRWTTSSSLGAMSLGASASVSGGRVRSRPPAASDSELQGIPPTSELLAMLADTDEQLAGVAKRQEDILANRQPLKQDSSLAASSRTLRRKLNFALPPPRWPDFSNEQPRRMSLRCPIVEDYTMRERSRSMPVLDKLLSAPGDKHVEFEFSTQDLCEWIQSIMDPGHDPSGEHEILESMILRAKAIEKKRKKRLQQRLQGGSRPGTHETEGAVSRAESIKKFEFGLQTDTKMQTFLKQHGNAHRFGRAATWPMRCLWRDESESDENQSEPASPKATKTPRRRPLKMEDKKEKRKLSGLSTRVGRTYGDLSSIGLHSDHQRSMDVNVNRALTWFTHFAYDGEISVDRLGEVLALVGHPGVGRDWIHSIIDDKFRGRGHLDREDFIDFIGEYEARFRHHITEAFRKADFNNSGSLSASEISSLLRNNGITPWHGVVEDLILEITGVDHAVAEVDVNDFVRLYDIMTGRSGFTMKEVQHLKDTFKRYDRDDSGTIDILELRAALSWSGFAFREDVTDELIVKASLSVEGPFSENQFWRIMREHREHEVQVILSSFGAADADLSGYIDHEELPNVFENLGYFTASPAVIRECMEACHLKDSEDGLIFEEFYSLLSEFRNRQSFLNEELHDIHECFRKCDRERTGGLGPMELGAAVRYLGYPMTFDEVQEFVQDFDLSESGELNLQEFLKVLRRYRESEVLKIRELFAKPGGEQQDEHLERRVMNAMELRMLFLSLGHMPNLKQVHAMLKEVGGDSRPLDMWEVDALLTKYRLEARNTLRKHRGFSDSKVMKLRGVFNSYDPPGTGFIEKSYLAKLFADLFPAMAYDVKVHASAKELLREVDEDGDGKLNFSEFLQLMRISQDNSDRQKLEKERAAVADCGFKRDEVLQYRKVFQMFDADKSGDLCMDEFEKILASAVVVKGHRGRSEELQAMLSEVDESGKRTLDFPAFLRVMKMIEMRNWGTA